FVGPPLLVVYHTRRHGCQDKQERRVLRSPVVVVGRVSIAGDSYGVPCVVFGLRVYRQETPTESGALMLGCVSIDRRLLRSPIASMVGRGSLDRRLLRSPAPRRRVGFYL